jgi:hypothetical protein
MEFEREDQERKIDSNQTEKKEKSYGHPPPLPSPFPKGLFAASKNARTKS